MNILHITTFLQGGAGKIIKDLAIFQKKKGNNVFIICNDMEESGYINYTEYTEKLKQMDISVYKINSTFKRDIYLNMNAVSFVRSIIKDKNIDIIHAHAAVPAFIGINARLGIEKYIPVIETMHGWGTNKRIEQENMDITIINGLDKLIAVSQSDKSLLVNKGVNKDLIDVVYNGIEDKIGEVYCEDEVIIDIIQHKKNGYKILGIIGTVCHRKNQALIIESFKYLNKKIFCPVIGDGEIIDKLREKSISLNLENNIKFYGYKENASKYLKYFDYQLITSLSEGFGIVIIESFREKTPVIASDIDVFKELICNNRNGYLFENNNPQSLANIIDYILSNESNEKNNIVNNAYMNYNNKFTIDKMLKSYDKEYSKLYDKAISFKLI